MIPLYIPQCGDCKFCKSPKTNLCQKVRATQGRGVLPDGTTRFICKGQPVFHYMGCSTFSEYTVVADISVAKVICFVLSWKQINSFCFIFIFIDKREGFVR